MTASSRAARRAELARLVRASTSTGFRAPRGARSATTSAGALASARLDDARLETRTKALDSFLDKATKSDGRGGFKYADPTTQLTDFVGARVLVPLSADVAPVARLVQRLYVVEEMSDQRADTLLDVPGYQSLHFLVRFRDEDREALGVSDRPVELQVRSILQHAWASLQHDLMYKGERAPTDSVRRRLIALAGLLELADHEFMAVRLAHGDAAGMLDDAHAGGFDVSWGAGVGRAAGRRRGRRRAARVGGGAAHRADRARRDDGRRGHRAAGRVGRARARAGAYRARHAALGHGVVRRRPRAAARARRRLPRAPRGDRPDRRRRAHPRDR